MSFMDGRFSIILSLNFTFILFFVNDRYIDDSFFTSNEPKEKIEAMLKKANDFHPNIKLEAKIGSCVPFLDLLISNNNGILSSSVYHKPATEPCVLPFISDHPRHIFINIIQAALLRAVRFSSTLEIFQKEYRTIRLMLLYNGYVCVCVFYFTQINAYSSIVPYFVDIHRNILIHIFKNSSINIHLFHLFYH
jgi:hypothetical protein